MLQFSDAELACRLALQGRKQLFLGANAAVTRCLRRVFLRSSSIKLGFSDVSDSISLSQAVHQYIHDTFGIILSQGSVLSATKRVQHSSSEVERSPGQILDMSADFHCARSSVAEARYSENLASQFAANTWPIRQIWWQHVPQSLCAVTLTDLRHQHNHFLSQLWRKWITLRRKN